MSARQPTPPTILVVDDQPANLKLISSMLTRAGYAYVAASNGREAIEVVLSQPVDLILMDVMMPIMDGIEAAHLLRRHETAQYIPIIFVSAMADVSEKVRAFDAGAVDYLTRPFDVHELQRRIQTHLELQQHRIENRLLLNEKQSSIERLEQEIHLRRDAEHELYAANKRLTIINHLTTFTQQRLDSAHVLAATSQQLLSAVNASCCFALQLVGTPPQVRLEGVYPVEEKQPHSLETALPTALTASYLLGLSYPLVLTQDDPVFGPLVEAITGKSYQRLIIQAILVKNTVCAVIGLCWHVRQVFNYDKMAIISDVCHIAAQALDNSLLHEHSESLNQRLGNLVNERTDQLNRLNQRTNAILANVTDAIVVLDAQGTVDVTNAGFDHLFGYETDALFGQPVTVLTTPDQAALLAEAIQTVQPQHPKRLQLVLQRQDSSTFDADVAVAIIRNPQDDFQYMVMCHDVSSFKELERMKDSFISMVTHELRTPIAGIQLIANQLYQYDDRLEKTLRLHKLDQLIMQSNVMAELIESVLDIARLESRRLKNYPAELVDMVVLLNGVIDQQQPISSEHQQQLTVEIDDDIPLVAGDNGELERVWRNLISNAIKYTPDHGAITVRLGWKQATPNPHLSPAFTPRFDQLQALLPAGDCVIGEVSDNGHGMDAAQLNTLFRRFDRGWARQSKIPGTGLGLALVRELIDAYGGGIHVESTVGKGSTFLFWLPVSTYSGDEK